MFAPQQQKPLATRAISGHPDISPAMAKLKTDIVAICQDHAAARGFSPRETPLVERADLYSKPGERAEQQDDVAKQLVRLDSHPEYTLVPEHTASLARWVVASSNTITFPCKTSMHAKAFRGERTQHGRRREFSQFDMDIVDTAVPKVPSSEFDIITLTHDILKDIGVKDFIIKIGDRALVNQALELYGLNPKEEAFLRAIDKLEKQSPEEIIDGVVRGSQFEAEDIRKLVSLLDRMKTDLGGLTSEVSAKDRSGEMGYLNTLLGSLRAYGLDEKTARLDLGTVRGLSYYNGVVFEVSLSDSAHTGSIAGGGRFDSLFTKFTRRQHFGFGAAIGIDRIVDYLGDSLTAVTRAPEGVFLDMSSQDRFLECATMVAAMRKENINVVSGGKDADLGKKIGEAVGAGCRLFAFPNNQGPGYFLKNLVTREQSGPLSADELIARVKS